MAGAANGYNPAHVQVNSSIYAPSGDWGVDLWSNLATFKEGDLVLDNTNTTTPRLLEFNYLVKGNYHGGAYDQGSCLLRWNLAHRGSIQRQQPEYGCGSSNLANLVAFNASSYESGDPVKTATDRVRIAGSNMRGSYDPSKAYSANDVVRGTNSAYYQFRCRAPRKMAVGHDHWRQRDRLRQWGSLPKSNGEETPPPPRV